MVAAAANRRGSDRGRAAYHRHDDARPTSRPCRLTTLTDCGGCAAKLGADLLSEALAGLGAVAAAGELIAGLEPPDDAAAYRVSDDLAIIGTLDFFPRSSTTPGRSARSPPRTR